MWRLLEKYIIVGGRKKNYPDLKKKFSKRHFRHLFLKDFFDTPDNQHKILETITNPIHKAKMLVRENIFFKTGRNYEI